MRGVQSLQCSSGCQKLQLWAIIVCCLADLNKESEAPGEKSREKMNTKGHSYSTVKDKVELVIIKINEAACINLVEKC
jgi:hypothetical protein